MRLEGLLTLLALLNGLFIAFGRGRLLDLRNRGIAIASAPIHHGILVAALSAGSAAVLILIWLAVENWWLHADIISQLQSILSGSQTDAPAQLDLIADQIKSAAAFLSDPAFLDLRAEYQAELAASRFWLSLAAISLTLFLGATLLYAIPPHYAAQKTNERLANGVMFICGSVAVLVTISVFLSLITETIRFFELISPLEFFFGSEWSPQIALRQGQVAAEGKFGAIPLFVGTLTITLIALLISGPIGLMSAIYMSEYASEKIRTAVKPVLEILAGVPTVVYGFFAALTLAPFIRGAAETLGLAASSESALAAGIVMGIMIIPFISSLSDDVISAVPHNLREGSYALGATQSETIRKVVLPAALAGIFSAFLLAISRAIGETMIVVMAAGLAANLTANPLEAMTTVTVQIVTLLVGDQEFDSPKTLAAFALGMTLFVITFILNLVALMTVRRYRERYE